MTNSASLPPDEDLTEVRKPTSLLIAQFFLFPLIIIGICIGLFLLFGYLTYDQRTAEEYLDKVGGGTGTQRWQAAYELSHLVKKNPDRARTPEFVESLTNAYRNSPDQDIRVRSYLALILGELKDRSAVPVLVEGLNREERLKSADWTREGFLGWVFRPSLDEIARDLAQSQIYALFALGSIGDNSAVPGVLEQVQNRDGLVRKVAAWVLGMLGDPRAVEPLRPLLNDNEEDVRWYAALALAQLGDGEGADLLIKLLDHGYVDTLPDMTAEQKTELIVNAVKGLGILKHEPALERIRALSESDPVPAVRSAALEALKKF
jgi:HEAT repeat protein